MVLISDLSMMSLQISFPFFPPKKIWVTSLCSKIKDTCLLVALTGIGTILNQSKPKKKDNIAVIGCGGIGLSTLIGLNIAKIKNIDCFDVKLKNLDKAKILGAKSCYLIKDFNFKKKLCFYR